MSEGLYDCSDSLEVISLPLCLYVYIYAPMFASIPLYLYAPMSALSLVSPLTKVNTKIEPKSN